MNRNDDTARADEHRRELAGMLADREPLAARYQKWAEGAAADAARYRQRADAAVTTADHRRYTRLARDLADDAASYARQAAALDVEIANLRRALGR